MLTYLGVRETKPVCVCVPLNDGGLVSVSMDFTTRFLVGGALGVSKMLWLISICPSAR